MNRIVTGLVAGAGWFHVVNAESIQLLWLVLSVLAGMAMREYFSITLKDRERRFILPSVILGLLPLAGGLSGQADGVLAGYLLSIILFLVLITFRFSGTINPFALLSRFNFGITYVGLCAAHLLLLKTGENGHFWLMLLTVVIVASDTGAFYTGTLFGRTKLCPAISPGKTVEGFLGGLFFAAVAATLFSMIMRPELNVFRIILLALILACIGVIGDLTESIFKRSNQVKDSGSILPGHGGILDRVDSILVSAPVLYYLIHFKILTAS